jgi:hypothetical protein
MQDILESLRRMVGREDRLFTVYDLRGLFLSESDSSFYPVLSRLVSKGWLIRVCRGVYMLPDCELRGGELLGRTAAVLRARYFNYLSLETVLSESGVISQIPMGRIMVMSSGRSNVISCGDYGTIEFLHTSKSPDRLSGSLVYDSRYHLWRATVCQAIQDMRDTQRDMGLIDWEVVDEFV